MNTETPHNIRKRDTGSIAANKLLLVGSVALLTVAAFALAFLWYSASTKDAKLEREKEDIKLERQLAKDTEKQQSAVVVALPESLPIIDVEPAIPSEHKSVPKPPSHSQAQAPDDMQLPQSVSSPKAHYKGWKKYLAVTTDDYTTSFLFAPLEINLLH